jgi:cobalt-zinc-cadmium efflux system protein
MLVEEALRAVPGVVDVHDLHVWTLTSQMDVVTAHLAVGPDTAAVEVLAAARNTLTVRFGLTHATLQVEPITDCEHPEW